MELRAETVIAELPARISDIPYRWREKTPDAPAVVYSGTVWSFGRLVDAVEEWANFLREAGVRPGDRVMVLGENCAALVSLLFALAKLDAWSVNINARLSDREVSTIREHCGARRLVYLSAASSDAAAHGAQDGAKECELPVNGRFMLGPLNESCVPEPVFAENDRQVAVLVYTSGTTGHPKGVMLTQRNLLFAAAMSGGMRRLVPDDRVYGVLPASHVFGLTSVMLASLYAGCCLFPVSRFSAEALLDAVEQDGITVFQGVPAMYARFLEIAAKTGRRPRSGTLRFIYAGGSPLDITLKSESEALFGLQLHNGYGMTESSPTICQTRLDVPRKDTSVGQVIPGVDIRIVDEHGGDVAEGEAGELWIRGPNVMKGYYHEPELTESVMRPGGWLNTGDVARRDPDGALFIVGRTKELIIRSGFNVYPVEVESVLNSHPAVVQSAVVGRPVGEGNEEVVAFVELAPGFEGVPADLEDYVAGRLSPYKRPAQIVVVENLPAAATGKVLKSKLREAARELAKK